MIKSYILFLFCLYLNIQMYDISNRKSHKMSGWTNSCSLRVLKTKENNKLSRLIIIIFALSIQTKKLYPLNAMSFLILFLIRSSTFVLDYRFSNILYDILDRLVLSKCESGAVTLVRLMASLPLC